MQIETVETDAARKAIARQFLEQPSMELAMMLSRSYLGSIRIMAMPEYAQSKKPRFRGAAQLARPHAIASTASPLTG